MPLSYALTTWPHLKAALRSRVDDELRAEQLIDAATVAIENYLRFPVVQRSFTEKYYGGARRLFLQHYPITSITSIQDDQTPATSVASTSYHLNADEGWLEYIGGNWPTPIYAWTVTYVAGVAADVDAVPENIREACHLTVADILGQPQRPVSGESSGNMNVQYAHLERLTLPAAAIMLLPRPHFVGVG